MFKVGDRVIRKPDSPALIKGGNVSPGSIGQVIQVIDDVGQLMRIRWETPAFWPYKESWFEMKNFEDYTEKEGTHRWKLSDLQDVLKGDSDHWAVHCPICRVVSFATHGDYVCIACRTGENNPERMRLLSTEDPEEGDELA